MPQTDVFPEYAVTHAQAIARAIDAVDNVVVAAHVNPDGDALGALVCAALLLQARRKQVVLYSTTGIPDFLSFFPLPCPLVTDVADMPFTPKSAFLVDIGDFRRIGGSFEECAKTLPRINVDHHEGQGIGTLATWVEPKAAATTVLFAYVAREMGLSLDGLLGSAIALGIITDTGNFAHGNTNAEVFTLCAALANAGVNFSKLREYIDGNIRHERLHLWARLSEQITFMHEGRLAMCCATRADLAACGARREDLEGFVEYMRRLKGVSVALLVKEEGDALCKYSLRSFSLDVCAFARVLNGGGHKNAAGGTLRVPLGQACDMLLGTLADV